MSKLPLPLTALSEAQRAQALEGFAIIPTQIERILKANETNIISKDVFESTQANFGYWRILNLFHGGISKTFV